MGDLLLLKGATLIDGTGKEPIKDSEILIDGNIIKEVGRADEITINENVNLVDLTGKTIIPGIINTHLHVLLEPTADPFGLALKESKTKMVLRGVKNLKKLLISGVTFFRDLGGFDYINLELKKCIDEEFLTAPDFLTCGKVITMTGGHGYVMGRECDGIDEVRKATREQLKAGVDCIKVMATGGAMDGDEDCGIGPAQLTKDELKAAVEEAHKTGKKVAAHAGGLVGIKNAIYANVDSIEHGIDLDDEAIELMVQKDIFLVPTFCAPFFIMQYGYDLGIAKSVVEKTKAIVETHIRSFQKAQKAGVKIAMGSDSGTPFNFHDKSLFEIKLMVEYGMSTLQAITSATKNSSELLGIADRYGTIEEGKMADLLVLNKNPLENIDTIMDDKQVYKNGKLIACNGRLL